MLRDWELIKYTKVFILKYVVEQSTLIFSIIEVKNFRIALAIVQFFNEK